MSVLQCAVLKRNPTHALVTKLRKAPYTRVKSQREKDLAKTKYPRFSFRPMEEVETVSDDGTISYDVIGGYEGTTAEYVKEYCEANHLIY